MCIRDRPVTVELLLDNGANLYSKDKRRRTAHIWANNKRHINVLEILQRHLVIHNTAIDYTWMSSYLVRYPNTWKYLKNKDTGLAIFTADLEHTLETLPEVLCLYIITLAFGNDILPNIQVKTFDKAERLLLNITNM